MSYRRISPGRPLPIPTPSEIFGPELARCITDKRSDLSEVLSLLRPFLHHLGHQLRLQAQPDFHSLALLGMLSQDPERATAMLRYWARQSDLLGSVEEELEILLIERLRRLEYVSEKANPVMLEWLLVTDLRQQLCNRIRYRWRRRPQRLPSEPTIEEAQEPEVWILDAIARDPWHHYLFFLASKEARLGLRVQATTHIPRETYYWEERALWLHATKQLQT